MSEAQLSFLLVLGIHMHNAFELAAALPSWRAHQRTSILSFEAANRCVLGNLCIKLHKSAKRSESFLPSISYNDVKG